VEVTSSAVVVVAVAAAAAGSASTTGPGDMVLAAVYTLLVFWDNERE
jgi:hypothetical protein